MNGYAFFVRLARVDDLIARMSFLHENEHEMIIPNNIRLYTETNVEQQPFQNSFFITCFGNYTLRDTMADIVLCYISNQRQQSIYGGVNIWICLSAANSRMYF